MPAIEDTSGHFLAAMTCNSFPSGIDDSVASSFAAIRTFEKKTVL